MEDIIFDEYDEYELQKKVEMKTSKQHLYSRGFRKCALALVIAVCVSTGFSAVPGKFDNMAIVEAAKKKDNKKPVIKLQGAASLQVTQSESVKIPKATAKDNVDGNLTKKIKVSVKCGKKSYASIAKKIQKNKAVKFTKTGKYTITYTVSDKAKNKATKKRTVTVVAKQEDKKITENKTTAEQTTESKVTTEQVTTAATAEATTESSSNANDIALLKKYGNLGTITIGGNDYNILKDVTDDMKRTIDVASPEWNELTADKFLPTVFGTSDDSYYFHNYGVLEYVSKLCVTDKYGVDCSDTICILEPWKIDTLALCYVNSKGEVNLLTGISFTSYEFAIDFFKDSYVYNDVENAICIVGNDYRKIEDTKLLHTKGKNADDVAALQKIVIQQNSKGARLPLDLDNENGAYSWYTWDENGRLVELNWWYKGIQGEISFEGLTELKKINCEENRITDLSVNKNIKLESLKCWANQIKQLDVSNNSNLIELSCSSNHLEGLDTRNNKLLTTLDCGANRLTNIDVSNNKELENLYFSNNKISEIDLSNNTKLTSVLCYNNQLGNLDLENNVNLYQLNCWNNQLDKLDLKTNKELSYLDCSDNNIAELDISDNTNLYSLRCADNQLEQLDISKNISLRRLNCRNNKIKELDVSANDLDNLECDENVAVKR